MKNLRGNKWIFKNVPVSTRKATVTLEKEGRRSCWLEIMQKRTATCHQKKKVLKYFLYDRNLKKNVEIHVIQD